MTKPRVKSKSKRISRQEMGECVAKVLYLVNIPPNVYYSGIELSKMLKPVLKTLEKMNWKSLKS